MSCAQDASRLAVPNSVESDWLPYQRKCSLPLKGSIMQLVGAQKHRDWFLAFIWLLLTDGENGNELQGKMLFKLYSFMRDFFPQGLINNLSHFDGGEVMEQLTHHNETSASRHVVAKSARAAFLKLEDWMGPHKNWQQALDHAKAHHENHTSVKAKNKKNSWKAPGLHSPAGMMALLVIAHPDDTKFKQVISRLQIQWMMLLDRESFEVREGFWQGINDKNLYSVFFPADARDAMSPLVADYGRLFGSDFPDCRRNIIPYLPAWAGQITLTEAPSDDERDQAGKVVVGTDSDILSDLPSDLPDNDEVPEADGTHHDMETAQHDTIICDDGDKSSREQGSPDIISASMIQNLKELLEVHDSSPAVEDWLFQRLDDDVGGKVLPAWVRFWEGRIDKVDNAVVQTLTRELFFQSLCRVKSLVLGSMLPMADAHMLTDMLDGRLEGDTPSSFLMAKQLLDDFPEYRSYTDAFNKFKSTVESSVSPKANDLLNVLFRMQTCFFHHLTLGTSFFEYWQDVTLYETYRTYILVQDVHDCTARMELDSDLLFWRSQRELLLRDETAESLQLTPWQRRALLFPGSGYMHIFTPSQELYFRCKMIKNLPFAIKHPTWVGHLPLDPMTKFDASPSASSAVAKYPGLRKLLGALVQLPERQQDPLGDCCRTPSTPVQPLALTTSHGTNLVPAHSTEVCTPSETASSSRTTWKRTTPSTGVTNVYAGKTSSKRTASPDRRHVKTARLDWKEELGTDIASLKAESRSAAAEAQNLKSAMSSVQTQMAELGTNHQVAIDELKGYTTKIQNELAELKEITVQGDAAELKRGITNIQAGLAELQSNNVQSDIANLREGVNNIQVDLAELPRTTAQSEIAKLKTGVEAELAALRASNIRVQREINIRVQREMMELRASIQSMGPSLIQSIKSEVASLRTAMTAELLPVLQTEIERMVIVPEKAPPALGDDGLLKHRCPAPPGWNQKEYEAELERAALLYICLHGRPDEGFGEDQDCLQETLERFPFLDQTHIATTLQHIHMRVFHRPIGHQDGLGDDIERGSWNEGSSSA